MTGAQLQLAFAQRLREFLASEACAFSLSWVGPVEEYASLPCPQFTVSDGSYDYTLVVQFEDSR